MAKTVLGLLQHCKNAKDWKYIYGMKGAVMSLSQYNSLKRMYGSMVWDSDKSKIGKMCCDCSGLISSYTGILRGSSEYESTATEKATITQLTSNWNKYIGWGIWFKGHIGVVSEIPGYYYAMDGSARNWSHRPLKDNKWTKVIKLKDIDYSVKVATTSTTNNKIISVVANKTYGFQITEDSLNVRDFPSTSGKIVAKLNKGSKQGIDQITEDGWGHIANNAGWIKLKGHSKPLEIVTYQASKNTSAMSFSGDQYKLVSSLKTGSRQPVCFVSKEGWGWISNYAAWIKVKDFKKV